ncbi:MAG TPA: hypothetical protein DIW30_01495 [Bacteroidales bacterium]|nr:hypothetical protein [Bacteroidales bacterium]
MNRYTFTKGTVIFFQQRRRNMDIVRMQQYNDMPYNQIFTTNKEREFHRFGRTLLYFITIKNGKRS